MHPAQLGRRKTLANLLEVKDLEVTFNGDDAAAIRLDKVSFTVEEGDSSVL